MGIFKPSVAILLSDVSLIVIEQDILYEKAINYTHQTQRYKLTLHKSKLNLSITKLLHLACLGGDIILIFL